MKFVADVLPNNTSVVPMNPTPVMTTDVPPASGPELGTMLVTDSTSSSVIVPSPCASANVAFTGLLRSTVNVSSASYKSSPCTTTVTFWVVSPGSTVNVCAGEIAV